MPATDKHIDSYIQKSAPFAQPILQHLRELVHRTCPETEEKMKWSFPHFDYMEQMMCSMAAFKQHVAFGFWKAPLLDDPKKILSKENAMGHLGKITSLDDLPSDKILVGFIRQAMKLNEEGKVVERRKIAKKEATLPEEFSKALRRNVTARKHFEAFSPGKRREYTDWIDEAKTDSTRAKRIETALEWIAEGKSRNWKYERR